MDEPYPTMKPDTAHPLPTNTGNRQPLWQAIAKKAPELRGKRVLALRAGDGWFCRYAVNHGAVAVLGVDADGEAVSAARATASSDRLRYRIMPDNQLKLLTGPYDVIAATFDTNADDVAGIVSLLGKRLRPGGTLLATLSSPVVPASADTHLAFTQLIPAALTLQALDQIADPRLPSQSVHFFLSATAGEPSKPRRRH
ncbi:SAM-dependent methyltransferase [Lacticaseibacillus nasuensis JCM 17158]|uniref:SAM-dependent methyltransferase n=3 Tax=Lacticaseibacillus TaxID=2759736 RepID=A0A0R1JT88_9LACO|nr:SAM-dependent methyltransferase [Lacticaseibacillus nasuensis JCM 17158]